ncbi:MAG: Bug family tripartite tricarboxylate transporter substrate binding protein [Rhodospirillaceae bacterium]
MTDNYRRRSIILGGILLFQCALSVQAAETAGTYPLRPIRVIVPYAPGGVSDITVRLVTTKASTSLGQQFIVDNRAGGSSTIGINMVAHAAPDGYTIGSVDAAFTITPSLMKVPYDPVADFAPITALTTTAFLLVVNPTVPAKNVKELVALAKARPGTLTFSSTGSGNNVHLSLEQFAMLTGMKAVHVPYKGGAPSVNALLSGEVDFTLGSRTGMVPHIKAGKARALAVTGNRRLPELPNVPTFDEQGLRFEVAPFYGMVAPARTPKAIIDKLNRALVEAMKSPDIAARLDDLGLDPIGNSPEVFADYIKHEIPKWAKVVKATGAKLD